MEEKELKEYLESLSKEQIIDLYLQKFFDNKQFIQLNNEIEELKNDISWYKMWHDNFRKEIDKLYTELETYRPTKLSGNGQCSCYLCEQKRGFNRYWTDWCYKYKGHIYCSDCLKQVLNKEKLIEKENKLKGD